MYRDVTDVTLWGGDGCNVIVDDQTINVYHTTSSDVQIYKLVGDKYLKLRDTTYLEPDDRQGYTCVDDAYFAAMPSRYDFMTPVFDTMAILMIAAIVFGAFRLIVYPFFRRKL